MFLGFHGLRGLIGLLSARLAGALGAAVGWLAYSLLRGQRRLTLQHLAYGFGEAMPEVERRRVARRVFMNLGRNALEWLQLPRRSLDDIQRQVTAQGVEHVRDALAKGAGVIMVSGHFGNWEILPLYFRTLGFDRGGVLARPLRYPEYEAFFIGMRAAKGVPTIARGSVKDVARALRANGLVGMMPDQDIASMEGMFVEFFGHSAYTPVGPAALSLMTGAPIVPCFVIRDGRRFRIAIEPPLTAPEGVERPQALAQLTQAWSDVVESYIRRYPDHWVWMHRRWKTQPVTSGQWSVVSAERTSSRPAAGRSGQPAIVVSILLAASALLPSLGCSGGGAPKAARSTAGEEAGDQEMGGFSLTGYEADGTKRWELDGTGASVDQHIMTIKRPNGIGYDLARTSYLTASVAQVDQRDRHVRLEHDVTLHTSDGLWLATPVLHWIPDQERVATDAPVRIETDHMLVRGRGANGVTQMKHLTLLRDIELVLNPTEHEVPGQETGHVRITCDGPLTFDYENHIATFEHNVHVEDPNGDIYSDKLIAYLNQATRTIRYAEAVGNVRIHQEQNTAHSDRAIYEPHMGKITLVGKPSLLVYPSDQNSDAQMAFGGLSAAPEDRVRSAAPASAAAQAAAGRQAGLTAGTEPPAPQAPPAPRAYGGVGLPVGPEAR
jgi:KDO2-lipid IV(A) lauroyltransferase